jgi:DNA-directed RNA polymerase specialized sigma24 family protein
MNSQTGCATEVDKRSLVHEDRELVERCIAGEVAAWETLYHRHHDGLLTAIRATLGRRFADPNLVDEIAARVWYALVVRDAELLSRFAEDRGCRLSTYLAAIAKRQAASLLRRERRRRRRERLASQAAPRPGAGDDGTASAELDELVRQLTPREREFFDGQLTATAGTEGAEDYSEANRWQLRSRIHRKLMKLIAH